MTLTDSVPVIKGSDVMRCHNYVCTANVAWGGGYRGALFLKTNRVKPIHSLTRRSARISTLLLIETPTWQTTFAYGLCSRESGERVGRWDLGTTEGFGR